MVCACGKEYSECPITDGCRTLNVYLHQLVKGEGYDIIGDRPAFIWLRCPAMYMVNTPGYTNSHDSLIEALESLHCDKYDAFEDCLGELYDFAPHPIYTARLIKPRDIAYALFTAMKLEAHEKY